MGAEIKREQKKNRTKIAMERKRNGKKQQKNEIEIPNYYFILL